MKLGRVLKTRPIAIIPNKEYSRWYRIGWMSVIAVQIDDYWMIYTVTDRFHFDGRSGGKIPDLFEPNLGTQADTIDWLIHDLNGYGLFLNFQDTNELLRLMRIQSGSSAFSASAVKKSVSISKSWFGLPKPEDREYSNLQTFNIRKTDTLPDLNWLDKGED